MSMDEFSASADTGGPLPVLHLCGVLDRDAETALLTAFRLAIAADPDRVLIDVADMTYMNSSGIANVVVLLREAREHQVAVTVRGLTAHYRHLFEITRIADLVDIQEDTA